MRLLAAGLVCTAMLCGCATNPAGTGSQVGKTGNIGVSVSITATSGLAKTQKKMFTEWSSLRIRLIDGDSVVVRDTSVSIGIDDRIARHELRGIPAGEYSIRVWTEQEKNGEMLTIHAPVTHVCEVRHGETSNASFILAPEYGSILLAFSDTEPGIDTVKASYRIESTTISVRDSCTPVSGRVYLSLDYIPVDSEGTLRIWGKDGGEMIYDTSLYAYSFTGQDNSLSLRWGTPKGNLVISAGIKMPGVTMIGGFMNEARQDYPTVSTGPVYIHEVVASHNEYEFIELYNPSSFSYTYDSLYVDCYSSSAIETLLCDITIPAQDCFVIGADSVQEADVTLPDLSNLVGTFGYLSIKTSADTALDWLVYSNDATYGWPRATASESLVFDTAQYGAAAGHVYNDFGKYWRDTSHVTPGR